MRKPVTQVLALGLLTSVGVLSGCATTVAPDDPVAVKVGDLDTRVQRIERVNGNLVDMAQRLDSLQAENRQLRGRIEQLENSNEGLRKQQRDLYSDLDKRLAAAQSPSGSTGSAGEGAVPAGASSTEQTVYSQAFDALKARSYSVAIATFKNFLDTYPQSPLAENAQYWLGEAYYVSRDFDSAAVAFRNVTTKYPASRKVPDALLKLGYTQVEQKKLNDARASLNDVIKKYPDSDAARLANEKLRSLPLS